MIYMLLSMLQECLTGTTAYSNDNMLLSMLQGCLTQTTAYSNDLHVVVYVAGMFDRDNCLQ